MEKKTLRLAAIAALCSAIGGCGSVMNLICDNTPYGGVAADLEAWKDEFHRSDPSIGMIAFATADLPFSLIGDTVVLPYTVPSHYFFNVGKHCSFVEL